MNTEEIKKRFSYHHPAGTQPQRYKLIRENAINFAYAIERMCPESREKSLAFTKLEEVVMWANAAIARNSVEEKKDDKMPSC